MIKYFPVLFRVIYVFALVENKYEILVAMFRNCLANTHSILFHRGNINVGSHTSEHQLEPITRNSTFFVDGDYLGLSGGSTSAGYNYLDTNFLPSAS